MAQQLSDLKDEYGIKLGSWHQDALLSTLSREADDITATLTSICSVLTDLSAYISLTQRAVQRIKSKISEPLCTVDELEKLLQKATVDWSNDFQQINAILQCLHRSKTSVGATSLLLANFKASHTLQASGFEAASRAVQNDSTAGLEACFHDGAIYAGAPGSQAALLSLTKMAILHSSSQCLSQLVHRLITTNPLSQYPSQNPLRLLILHAAHHEDKRLIDHATSQAMRLMWAQLEPENQVQLLLSPDSLGRLPLHYAAASGMTDTCSDMVQRLAVIQGTAPADKTLVLLTPDRLGETPLSSAISQGQLQVLKNFLRLLYPFHSSTSPDRVESYDGLFHGMLSLAIRSQRVHITEALIDHEPQVLKRQPKIHELLYLASQYGQPSVVERIASHTRNINVGVEPSGRTSLMEAAIYEHTAVVDILLAHPSCDIGVLDHNGWTAIDHAAFKGPPALVTKLQGLSKEPPVSLEWRAHHKQDVQLPSERPDRRNRASVDIGINGESQTCSHILLNLGHFDMEKEFKILDVDPFRRLIAPMQVPESSLTLDISAIDCHATRPCRVSLPVLEDLSNDPFLFTATTSDSAKLLFRVYSIALPGQCALHPGKPIGSAVVSLKDLRRGLGASLESLERDYTVSLVSSDESGSNFIGTLTFTYVIAKPFQFEGSPPAPSRLTLTQEDSPLIAGHRGNFHRSDTQLHLWLTSTD